MRPINGRIINKIKDRVVTLMSLTDRIDNNGYFDPEDDELAVKEMIEATEWLNNYLKELYNSK